MIGDPGHLSHFCSWKKFLTTTPTSDPGKTEVDFDSIRSLIHWFNKSNCICHVSLERVSQNTM